MEKFIFVKIFFKIICFGEIFVVCENFEGRKGGLEVHIKKGRIFGMEVQQVWQI